MKTDATSAKGADESSFLLLEKAEMVLITTIERTNKLLTEKKERLAVCEAELKLRQEEVARATEASNQATEVANERISIWLAAEENLVKTTLLVEREKAEAEVALANHLAEFDRQIEATEGKVLFLKEEVARLEEEAEKAQEAYEESAAAFARIDAQLEELHQAAQVETAQLEAESAKRLAAIRETLSQAQAQLDVRQEEYEKFRTERDLAAEPFAEQLTAFHGEQAQLQEDLKEKQNLVQHLESTATEKEIAYKNTLSEMRSQIEALQEKIKTTRAQSVEEAEAIAQNKALYAEACNRLDCQQEEATREEASARAKMAAVLAPKEQISTAAKEKVSVLAATLNQKRLVAGTAVKEAADKFSERLAAVNAVSIKKIENEIAHLKENVAQLYGKEEEEKRQYEEAEATYQEADRQAKTLNEEEAQISHEAEKKYHSIEAEKNKVLEKLQRELEKLTTEENAKRSEAELTTSLLQEILDKRHAAEEALEAAEALKAAVQAETDAEMAELDARYATEGEALAQGLPELLAAYESALAESKQTASVVETISETYQQQVSEVERLLAIEKEEPDLAKQQIQVVKDKQEALLWAVKKQLSALEEREKDLQLTYQKSCEYAERSDQAKANVEEYLRKLQAEEAGERQQAESELAAVEARLAALKEGLRK